MKILYKNIVVNAKKSDDKIYKSWKADLVDANESVLLFRGIFDREIRHSHLGIIRLGTISLEYFWLNENFNIFKFFEPEGTFRNFYCNVCLPPTFENGVLEYIDLDIDVIVSEDFSYAVLDMDEFETNAVEFCYSDELRQVAEVSLQNIIHKIRSKSFPFESKNLIYNL